MKYKYLINLTDTCDINFNKKLNLIFWHSVNRTVQFNIIHTKKLTFFKFLFEELSCKYVLSPLDMLSFQDVL